MSWLFNRDKTIAQLEQAYYQGVKDDAQEAIKAALEVEPLDGLERKELASLVDGHDDMLGGKLIELLSVGVRQETLDERLHEAAESAVIYTADVGLMLLISCNDGAYEDEVGEAPPTNEAKAAWAYVADARELLASNYVMADFARALLGQES